MKIEPISSHPCKGLIINHLLPKEAVGVLEKLRQRGPGYFMDLYVRSRVQILQVCQLKPRDFFVLASDRPLGFFELLNMAAGLGDKMLKGWMFYQHDGVIQEEATFSNCGITLNGKHKMTQDIRESISLVGKFSGEALREEQYLIGRNAGFFLLDAPQIAGIETSKLKGESGFCCVGDDILHLIKGALSAEKLIGLSLDLFRATHFVELELMQPVLPPLVTKASIFNNQEQGTMGIEMRFADSSQEIVNNIHDWL
jgi:hypothetical protein